MNTFRLRVNWNGPIGFTYNRSTTGKKCTSDNNK